MLIAAIVVGYFSPLGEKWRHSQQASSYSNLTVEQAKQKSQKEGLYYEEARVDGISKPQNANFNPKRLNVYVQNSRITDAYFDGERPGN